MKTEKSKQREGYWDVVKAFLILFVTWGHCIQFLQVPGDASLSSYWDSLCFKGIYLFHMPLFIGVSGYFAAGSIQRHGRNTLSRYGCRLMIPAISYALFHIGFISLVSEHPAYHPWKELANLWFLVVTFECVCLFYLSHFLQHRFFKMVWLLLPPILVTACENVFPTLFPAAFQFAYLWPFFLVGAWMKEYGMSAKSMRKWLAPMFLAVIPAAILCPPEAFVYITRLDFNYMAIAYAMLRTCIAFVLCAGFLGLSRFAYRLADCSLISGVAQATLALYVLQTFFFGVLRILLPHGVPHLNALSTLCLTSIIVVLLYYLYKLLRRLPLVALLLFGEKRRS